MDIKIIPRYVMPSHVSKTLDRPYVAPPKDISNTVVEIVAECMKNIDGAQLEHRQLLELSVLLERKARTMIRNL